MNQPGDKPIVPPYISYKTFWNFIEGLGVVPPVIDRSIMRNFGGSVQSQLMTSLRYLGLIDVNGKTQERFRLLANSSGSERQEKVRAMLEAAYPFLFDGTNGFDLSTATLRQFTEKFQEAGTKGDTTRKSQKFFLDAAEHAGLEISPHIKKSDTSSRSRSETGKTSRQRSQSRSPSRSSGRTEKKLTDLQVRNDSPAMSIDQLLLDKLLAKFPDFDPNSTGEEKLQWHTNFRELMKMVREATNPDDQNEDV